MEAPMTVLELSQYLKLDKITIYKLVKEGRIPAVRLGHQWRFLGDEVEQWLKSNSIGQKASVIVIHSEPSTLLSLIEELSLQNLSVSGEAPEGDIPQQDFDIAFLELSRPALQTVSKLRQDNPDIKIVLMADSGRVRLLNQAMEAGVFMPFFPKKCIFDLAIKNFEFLN